ncbi:MAG TPA: hypothetical protein VK943_16340, partial [Arenibaculum sp.]|nr:hypothetical protein [Arenibaculum sp.]
MKLRDLPSDEIGHALGRSGLILRVGPFTVAAHSRLREFRAALPLLYGGFTVPGPSEVVDIRVEIRGRRSFPAPWRRRAESLVNGRRSAAAQDRQLAPLLFEWGFNLWVGTRAHRYLILHAAVLERDGRALILPAPPGSGKSTLAAGLALGGWRLLSDEICLLRPEDGLAIPLPRPVALKRESIEIIRRFGGDPPMGPLM